MATAPDVPSAVPGPATSGPAARPFAAWLMLAALILVATVLVVGAARLFGWLAAHGETLGGYETAAVAVGWRVGLAAVLVFAAIGIHRRRQVGRWLGVAALAGFTAWSILRPETGQFDNDAQRGGALLARLFVLPLVFAWWAYAFAWSAKAKRYFDHGSARGL